MKGQDNRKYAIYSRKSKFTGKGESIENQIELCRQHIKLHHDNVTEEDVLVFEDEGFSGGNVNRPQFQAMMKQIRANQIQAVVCYRLDRISRNVGDFAKLKDEFDYYNVEFTSIRDDFDTTSPSGRAMMMMVSVFAQLERETTAERIRDNMHELAKSGRWLGGTTPTGYKSTQIVGSVTVDGKERKAYKLDIIKEEAEIIKLIFSKFIETNSLTKTDTYLLQNNITTKNEKNFTRFSIRSILQNPVYMIADQNAWEYFDSLGVEIYAEQSEFDGKHGIMAYNKTIQKSGKSNQMRDMDEWIVAVGKHKGLIAGDDWVRVQNMLNQNRSKSYRKPKSNVALLSGLLYCGNCGSFMRPKLSQRTNSQGEKIYSYLCETKERSRCQLCNSKNPNGNELDKMICEQVKLISEDSSDFIRNLEGVQRKLEGNREEYDQQLNALKKELQENEQQIANLVDTLAKTPNTPAFDYITQQIDTLHEKNEKIKNRTHELESLTKNHLYSSEEFDKTKELLKSFGRSFDTMGVEQKRMALRAFIRRIVWDGKNVHVVLFGDTESDIDYTDLAEENIEPLRADSERTEAVSAITTETSPYYHSFLFDSYENLAQALTSKSNGIYSDLRAEQLDYGRVYADTLSSFDSGEIDLFVPGINGKTASLRDAKGYVKISLMPRELYALPWIWYHCVVDNYDLTVQISYPSVLKNPEIDSAASYSDVLSIIAPDAPSPENFQQYESYNAIYEAEKVLADGRAVTAMISELKNSSKVYVMFYIDGVLVLLYADNQLFTESFLSTFDIVKY